MSEKQAGGPRPSPESTPREATRSPGTEQARLARRRFLGLFPALAAGVPGLTRVLAADGKDAALPTKDMIRDAEWLSGLSYTDADRDLMQPGMVDLRDGMERLRRVEIDNSVPPALQFSLGPGAAPAAHEARADRPAATPRLDERGRRGDDLAFASVTTLASLLRAGEITPLELTRLYLDRLKRFDPSLKCVITLTENLALDQAERATREMRARRHRGPLHGIPWGAKDLLAVPGYPTTWGATPYKDQVRPDTATVVRRLEEAGAILAAKTSVGALAWGDVWFGGMTRNPWRVEEGSSGSSAGSASAVAAGLVGFAIGTETWGSIVSPSTRCGTTGLRPTFGRVSRHGAMALAWSMDKIGPIARSAEDCALIFAAIHGADPLDPTVVEHPFPWPPKRDLGSLRVAYTPSLFDADYAEGAEDEASKGRMREWQRLDHEALAEMRRLGIELVPVSLPASLPVRDLSLILTAEAAAAFDDLTRSGRDDLLERQVADAWPNVLRQAQMIPAVEYIRANRIRTLLMRRMEEVFAEVDLYVSPTFGGDNLLITNLTGHPQVVFPDGFTANGTPVSLTLTGRLHGEADILAVARAYQEVTDFHRRRPVLTETPPA